MLYLLKTLFVIDGLMAIGLLLFRWALAPQHRDIVSGKLVALALLTPAVALFSGSIYLFCLYLALVVAFNSRRRDELAGTFLFLLPLVPLLTTETGVGGVYLLAVSTVLAMGLGALVGVLTTRGRGTRIVPRYELAMWAVVAIFMLIYNRDPSPTSLLRAVVINLLSFAAPYLLIARASRTPADVERMLVKLCLGVTLLAVSAYFQSRWRWVVFETYYQALDVPLPSLSASLSLRAGLLRTGGSMIDYGAGGLLLAVVVTLMPLLKRYFRPAGFWTVMAVMVAGLIVTQSRGAWVAAIAGLVFVAAYRGQWGRVLMMAGGAIAAEAAILVFATSGALAQIAGRTNEATGNVDYRQRLFSRGIDQIRSHPWSGQSQDQLIANLPDLMQGDHIVDFVNAHLFIAMAGGIPLFLAWCWIWLMPVIEGWRRRGSNDLLGAVPAAIVVPAMIALIFTSLIDRNLTWPTIALGLAPFCLATRRHRESKSDREPLKHGVAKANGGLRPMAPRLPHVGPA